MYTVVLVVTQEELQARRLAALSDRNRATVMAAMDQAPSVDESPRP